MSETRTRYPYPADCEVIDAFLMGEPLDNENSTLHALGASLYHNASAALAHYGKDDCEGDLCVTAQSPLMTLPFFVERVANYMLEALGSDERMTREINTDAPGAVNWRWVYEGKYILPNEVIILCGEMSIRAYRAERRMLKRTQTQTE